MRNPVNNFVYTPKKSTANLGWHTFPVKWLVVPLVILAGLLVVSCSPEANLEEPPEIRYGEDTCDRCLMIINEARFAAAYTTADGQTRRFDDIGGMVAYNEEMTEDVAVYWVHDFDTEEWLKADLAFYVKSDYLTPMGFGIVAFAEQDRAENWATEIEGMVVTFDELLAEGGNGDHAAAQNQE